MQQASMAQDEVIELSSPRSLRVAPGHHNGTGFAAAAPNTCDLTAGCLFSGMGGFASGFVDAGFTIRWANDNDEFACAAFRHRFPQVPLIEDDVRCLSVQSHGLEPVDVLTGGFPCQSFSQAGDRRGFDDPRGELFFEIPRLLEQFEPTLRPPIVVLENVPHLQYGADGSWFDRIRRELRRVGYWFRPESCWTVNVMDHTCLPQDRERLFLVAASRHRFSYNPFLASSMDGYRPPARQSLDELINRTKRCPEDSYLPPENRYYKEIDGAMLKGESQTNLYQLRRSYVREKRDGLCPTLTANMGIGGHNVPFLRDPWGIRRLSVAEVARLQGFDTRRELFPEIPTTEQYRLLGNAVCVQLAGLIAEKCATILYEESCK